MRGSPFFGSHPVKSSEHRFDAGNKFLRREGFHHIIVGAHFDAENSVDLLVAGGNNDYRGIGVLSDLIAKFKSAHARHHDIDNEHIRGGMQIFFERRLAVFENEDIKALFFKIGTDDVADIFLIVNDENFLCPSLSPL